MKKLFLILFFVFVAGSANAQVLPNGASCGSVSSGTSFTCNVGNQIGVNNSTSVVGINFNANVCSTINTPTNWTKVACVTFGTSSSAVYYKNSLTGDPNPITFSWTGNANANGFIIDEEGVLTASQLDVSNTGSGGSGTSVTVPTVTTTANVDHVVNWIFTDNAASGVTITAASPSVTQLSFNAGSYDNFVTEQRVKVAAASVGGGTATLSSASNWAAFTLAFKSLNPPVAQQIGDVVPLASAGSVVFKCTTNNVNCLTQADNAGTQQSLAFLDTNNKSNFGYNGGAGTILNAPAASNQNDVILAVGGAGIMGIGTTTVQVLGGSTFQINGGAVPTVTCSGGSTGASVAAGSTNNHGQITTSSVASTNCTLTWSAAGVWLNAPFCVWQSHGAVVAGLNDGTCGTSTCVVNFTSATSQVIDYSC